MATRMRLFDADHLCLVGGDMEHGRLANDACAREEALEWRANACGVGALANGRCSSQFAVTLAFSAGGARAVGVLGGAQAHCPKLTRMGELPAYRDATAFGQVGAASVVNRAAITVAEPSVRNSSIRITASDTKDRDSNEDSLLHGTPNRILTGIVCATISLAGCTQLEDGQDSRQQATQVQALTSSVSDPALRLGSDVGDSFVALLLDAGSVDPFVYRAEGEYVSLIVGTDLLPRACSGLPESDLASRARCFLRIGASEFGLDDADLARIELSKPVAGAEPGEEVVEARQFSFGTWVYPGHIKFDFVSGRLKAVVGRVVPTRSLPTVPPPPGATQFDSERQSYVRLVETSSDTVVLDALGGAELSRQSRLLYSNTTKLIKTWDFLSNVFISSSLPRTSKSTTMDVSPSGGTYLHDADRSGDGNIGSAYYEPTIQTILDQGDPGQDICSPRYYATISAPFSADPWSTVDDTSYLRYVAQAFYWLGILNDYRLHWSAGFGGTQTALPLSLLVTKCPGPGSNYSPSTHMLTLAAEERNGLTSVLNIDDMAHEFGHYIHHRYGDLGTRALKEGFASTMGRRWVKYAQEFRGELQSATYFSFQYAEMDSFVNGEYIPGWTDLVDNVACFQPNENVDGDQAYTCSAMVPHIYQELAWDVCGMSYATSVYGGCTTGQDLIQSGTYANTAVRLANASFARALWLLTTSSKVRDYVALVQNYYQLKRDDGTISSADYARVNSVFAHHCAGPTNHCYSTTLHRMPADTPGTLAVFPSFETVKDWTTFREAEQGLLSSGETVTNGTASNALFVRMQQPGARVTTTFSITSQNNGVYLTRLDARMVQAPAMVKVRAGSTGTWSNFSIPDASWTFYYSPAVFDSSATQTVSVELVSGQVDLDVVYAQRLF